MFQKFLDELKTLSFSDKALLGGSLLILLNYQFAIVLAVLVFCAFVRRFAIALKP